LWARSGIAVHSQIFHGEIASHSQQGVILFGYMLGIGLRDIAETALIAAFTADHHREMAGPPASRLRSRAGASAGPAGQADALRPAVPDLTH
jgi:hypothetical protein